MYLFTTFNKSIRTTIKNNKAINNVNMLICIRIRPERLQVNIYEQHDNLNLFTV